MPQIAPTLVFGSYLPGDWVSRYARFRVDLPTGRHRLTGRTYNPEGEDLFGNRLQIIVRRGFLAEVRPADPPDWLDFSIDLPEVETAESQFFVLRTTRFRAPPIPDERLLGLILDGFHVLLESGANSGYDAQAAREG